MLFRGHGFLLIALVWSLDQCFGQFIPVGNVQVSDPLGKWTANEKARVASFREQWQRAKMVQNTPGLGPPKPVLTQNQLDWLNSLANDTVQIGTGPRLIRQKRQTFVGPTLISNDNHDGHAGPNPITGNPRPPTTTIRPPINRWKAIRKEIRQMSRMELYRFSRAVYMMKRSYPDSRDPRSEYDVFMQLHQFALSPAAHNGAAFLPWHREYLWRFERALQRHVPDTSLPYWDVTLDQRLPNPQDSILWTGTFLGNANGQVFSGAFANFQAPPECSLQGSTLTRSMSSCPNQKTFLFSEEDIDYVMQRSSYTDISPNIDTKYEEDHGATHVCIGGHMTSIQCSPLDPVFFMLHTFIDCKWEEFRQTRQTTNVESDYPTWDDGDIGGDEHDRYAPMEPFTSYYNIHGLSNHYTRLYYECSNSPRTCRQSQDCGSAYLWCDTRIQRCVSMIQDGGDCTGLPDNACYGTDTQCIGNRCTRTRVDWSWWFRLNKK